MSNSIKTAFLRDILIQIRRQSCVSEMSQCMWESNFVDGAKPALVCGGGGADRDIISIVVGNYYSLESF